MNSDSSAAGKAFWNFSLSVYRQPGVPDECLALQELLDLDVNLLLFCTYMGAVKKVALSAAEIADAAAVVRDWHIDVVRSLRAARRALKPWSADSGVALSAGALRSTVKAAELEAERIEHDMLADWANTRSLGQPKAPQIAVPGNINALLDHYGNARDGNTTLSAAKLIAAALDHS